MADEINVTGQPGIYRLIAAVDTSSTEIRRLETEEVSGQTALLVKDLSSGGGGGDGAILDGVDDGIKATVLDYTNSNPLAVRLTDTNGDYVTAGGGDQFVDGDTYDAADKGTLALGTDGSDYFILRTTATGQLIINDGGNTITVDGTVNVGNFPASQTVDGTVDVGNFPATQTVDGTVNVGNFPASQAVEDGGGSLTVDDGGSSLTVDGTVTVGNFPASQTVDGTVSVGNFPSLYDVGGDVAADSPDSGDPVKVGGRADSTVPTAVTADEDRVDGWFDLSGRFITQSDWPDDPETVTGTRTTTGAVQVVAAPGSSKKICVLSLDVTNTSTSTVPVFKLVEDTGGSATTVYQLAATLNGGGFMKKWKRGLILGDNDNLGIELSVGATTVQYNIEYIVIDEN